MRSHARDEPVTYQLSQWQRRATELMPTIPAKSGRGQPPSGFAHPLARFANRRQMTHYDNSPTPDPLLDKRSVLPSFLGVVAGIVVVLAVMNAYHAPIVSFLLWTTPPVIVALLVRRYWLKPRHKHY